MWALYKRKPEKDKRKKSKEGKVMASNMEGIDIGYLEMLALMLILRIKIERTIVGISSMAFFIKKSSDKEVYFFEAIGAIDNLIDAKLCCLGPKLMCSTGKNTVRRGMSKPIILLPKGEAMIKEIRELKSLFLFHKFNPTFLLTSFIVSRTISLAFLAPSSKILFTFSGFFSSSFRFSLKGLK